MYGHIKSLFGILLSILLALYLEVNLLDHMVILVLISFRSYRTIPWQLQHFTFPPIGHKCSSFLHLLSNTCSFLLSFVFVVVMLMDMRWYLTVV